MATLSAKNTKKIQQQIVRENAFKKEVRRIVEKEFSRLHKEFLATFDNHPVTLEIKDDGIGITSDQISDNKSLGLLGMRERAQAWKGDVNIQGTHDQGTTVTINIQRN